jgi:maltose O-acetyltransferase
LTEREKMLAGGPYDSGAPELLASWHQAQNLLRAYNALPSEDCAAKTKLLTELLGGIGKNVWIAAPFYADYGKNIYLGDNCEINMNCVFLDNNVIRIGDNSLIAPSVQIYTAFHSTNAKERFGPARADGSRGFCRTLTAPVTIGNNVWIGGGAIILPGVTIGGDTVIGAGSVVTKDIPAGKIACGNPCRIIRDNS